VDKLQPIHEAQLLTYLKLSRIRRGLLINLTCPCSRRPENAWSSDFCYLLCVLPLCSLCLCGSFFPGRNHDRSAAPVSAAAAAQDYLDVLSDQVEAYEAEAVPMRPVGDADLLRFLIEHEGVTQAAVAAGAGIAESTISAVLAGKRKLNRGQIAGLARIFTSNRGRSYRLARECEPPPWLVARRVFHRSLAMSDHPDANNEPGVWLTHAANGQGKWKRPTKVKDH